MSRCYCGSRVFTVVLGVFPSLPFSLICSFPCVCVPADPHQIQLFNPGLFSTPVPDCSAAYDDYIVVACYCV